MVYRILTLELDMKRETYRTTLIAIFFVIVFATAAFGQGVIVPIICDVRPCLPRPLPRPMALPNALPIKSIKIDAKIDGQTSTTHVEQVFRNDTPFTLEGTWFFPIPESAAIVEFAIWENGKKLIGEVRSREEARRIYEQIVRRQKDPGLLEYAGRNLFQASIFPILPHSDKKLELTYTEILENSAGTIAYRYPLGTGGSRNAATIPEGVARDAVSSEITNVFGKIEITAAGGVRNIYSPTHTIDVSRRSERSATVSFETAKSDDDFELFFTPTGDTIGATLITYRETAKDGYFLLLISPRDDLKQSELPNKDIVFVLDTSGSMASDEKLEKAQKALQFGIQTLRPGDRFNVIAFSGEERLMEQKLINADESGKKRAAAFVEGLRASGGTNINDALISALTQFEAGDRPKIVVFMTDGIPTVGITDPESIAQNVTSSSAAAHGVRIFTFGFGYDVNAVLLDRIANDSGGAPDYVRPKEDLELRVSGFFDKVNFPVLTDLSIDYGSANVDLLYPRRISDLFHGSQLTIIGRYKNPADSRGNTITIRGRFGKQERVFRFRGMDFPLRNEKNDFIPRLWANRRVGWLLDELRRNGYSEEIRREIVELGTKYGIVTPYTSYLALDSAALGVSQQTGSTANANALQRMSSTTGEVAVEMSIRQNELKSSVSLAKDKSRTGETAGGFKRIGLKTFKLQNGIWTDTEYNPDQKLPETNLKYGSREYFDLAVSIPELGRYLSVGERVTVVLGGRVYKVD
ncbi:MAG: hypothetical protein C4325_01695 [Blastocatellia bacterium]